MPKSMPKPKPKLSFGMDLLFRATDIPEFLVGVDICEDYWAPVPPSSFAALAGAFLGGWHRREHHRPRLGRAGDHPRTTLTLVGLPENGYAPLALR